MHFFTLFTCLALMSTTGWAQYSLQQDYFQGDFLSQFSFFTGGDPTDGFVQYVDQGTAQAGGLVSNSGGSVHLGVNDRDVTSTGRQSVRLTSKQSYQSGLVILDLAHMPGGICGTWPAFWMVGPNWPSQGEIDIIEGVNDQQTNQMTLHTGQTCSIGGTSMLGSISSSNCDVSNGDNTGCPIVTNDRSTYGSGFNANGGGTYATEWTSSAISIYFWPRGQEPSDVTSGSPDPTSWGEPLAQFSGGCDISRSFTNQQIVFDTTFCGQWAGNVWDGSTCARSTGQSCEDYVGQNPSAFKEAYWTVNGLRVYQAGPGGAGPAPSGAPAPSYAPSGSAAPSGPSGSGAPFGPAPSGAPSQAPPPQGPAPSGAPMPSGAPSPSEGPTPPGGPGQGPPRERPHHHFGGPHHWRHHHPGVGPPVRNNWDDPQTEYETQIAYVTETHYVTQNYARATDVASAEDAVERRGRHLGHHRRHGLR